MLCMKYNVLWGKHVDTTKLIKNRRLRNVDMKKKRKITRHESYVKEKFRRETNNALDYKEEVKRLVM